MTKEVQTVRQRLRDVDEARGMIQEVGSRGRLRNYRKERLVIFKEEGVGGLEMVMILTDEDQVLQGGWTEIKPQR